MNGLQFVCELLASIEAMIIDRYGTALLGAVECMCIDGVPTMHEILSVSYLLLSCAVEKL